MFGSNYNISIFILATESMGQMKWGCSKKSYTGEFHLPSLFAKEPANGFQCFFSVLGEWWRGLSKGEN